MHLAASEGNMEVLKYLVDIKVRVHILTGLIVRRRSTYHLHTPAVTCYTYIQVRACLCPCLHVYERVRLQINTVF
jgi:hypothetical protein